MIVIRVVVARKVDRITRRAPIALMLLRHLLPRSRLHSFVRPFSSSHSQRMKIVPVPVRQDNYAYILIDEPSNKAAAVDPYDVPKVKAAADKLGVEIVAGITTHHHFDHSGGNEVGISCMTLIYDRSFQYHPSGVCAYHIMSVVINGSQPRTQRRRHILVFPSMGAVIRFLR